MLQVYPKYSIATRLDRTVQCGGTWHVYTVHQTLLSLVEVDLACETMFLTYKTICALACNANFVCHYKTKTRTCNWSSWQRNWNVTKPCTLTSLHHRQTEEGVVVLLTIHFTTVAMYDLSCMVPTCLQNLLVAPNKGGNLLPWQWYIHSPAIYNQNTGCEKTPQLLGRWLL